jgi:hypothetical protein
MASAPIPKIKLNNRFGVDVVVVEVDGVVDVVDPVVEVVC